MRRLAQTVSMWGADQIPLVDCRVRPLAELIAHTTWFWVDGGQAGAGGLAAVSANL